MKDYFIDECFQEGELQNECLYYLSLTQKNNFNRAMKNKKWLGTEKRLKKISVHQKRS